MAWPGVWPKPFSMVTVPSSICAPTGENCLLGVRISRCFWACLIMPGMAFGSRLVFEKSGFGERQ